MRQIFGEIRWDVKALIFLGLVLSFALFGPFGTYVELTFAERLSFWTGIMVFVGFFIHIAVHVSLTTTLLAGLRPLFRVWLGVAVGSVPASAMVAFLDRAFRGSVADGVDLFTLWWQVGLISAAIAPLEYLDLRASGAQPERVRSRLHDRLEPGVGQEIVSMSMQDHYVEVTTTVGRQLILLRLGDAMDEVQPVPGLQLHRSHWAARAHLRGLEKDGARHFATLSDGRRLPVSGTYLDAVQQALG